MPVKRRNNGRSKKNCGHTTTVRCQNCHRCVPKDKVIKRFTIRNIVDNTIAEDVLGACEVQGFALPKVYNKIQYCVSCALHNHLVHVRSREDRKIRSVPRRFARNAKPVRK
ncbi:Ribosomal protein S26 [Giardia muris]|uniref:40S ribosomal protein S26 n=1 Tax=Giardia muris TaxID=5742 RepID=A0A4Z1TDK0_GIAMU|nr:Ribosomal protein S26 [Giardia muris]|eukprot:TNJ30629.1 Ribosomal protein S26 [Giardia muris]